MKHQTRKFISNSQGKGRPKSMRPTNVSHKLINSPRARNNEPRVISMSRSAFQYTYSHNRSALDIRGVDYGVVASVPFIQARTLSVSQQTRSLTQKPPSNPTMIKKSSFTAFQLPEYILNYLDEAVRQRFISQDTVDIALDIWEDLHFLLPDGISVPSIACGADHQLLLSWDKGIHHFEIEVFTEDRVEFFYLNRQTRDTWDYDYDSQKPIPSELQTILRLFIAHGE